MESWEIIASVVTFVVILIVAFILHGLNWWNRWSVVESDSIRRITTTIPAGEVPALDIVQYEYAHRLNPVNAPQVMLLAPEAKYLRILDQYATGLCLAEIPASILKWKTKRGEKATSFATIAARVETLLKPEPPGIIFVVYQTGAREVIQGVACAAKNLNNRWILISPQIGDIGKWEIFSGNGEKLYILYSLDSPKKIMASIEDLKRKLQIPNQNLAPFPIGGMKLRGQETVALGKIISWITMNN